MSNCRANAWLKDVRQYLPGNGKHDWLYKNLRASVEVIYSFWSDGDGHMQVD